MILPSFLFVLVTILTACTTVTKFETANIESSLTPLLVVKNPVTTHGKNVIWGGIILTITNLKKETQIEILAYPLDANQRPLTNNKSLGRFIIIHSGYLEATVYTQGKQLSVRGKVNGTRSGKIGEAKYIYALIKSQQLHLWSKESESQTFFHFGIGIQL